MGGAALYAIHCRRSAESILNPANTPGSLHGLQLAVPRWSPDGSKIAFIGGLMSDQGATGGDLYLIPSTGGIPVDFTPDSKTTVSWIAWTPDQHILASEIDGGSVRFVDYAFTFPPSFHAPAGTRVLTLNRVQGNTLFSEPASMDSGELALSVSLSVDRHMVAYIRSSFDRPPEVYAASWAGRLQLSLITTTRSNHYGVRPSPSIGRTRDSTCRAGCCTHPIMILGRNTR